MTNLSTDLHDVEKIIVLDYGSQYNQLISRRIREIGVFSELKSHKISADEVRAINPVGIVLSGGPNSVYEEGSFDIDPEIFELGIPILGICYGMQLLTHKLGGKVVPAGDAGNREYGQSELTLTESSALFAGTPDKQLVLMSHGDAVTEIPADFIRTGTSADCPFASIENPDKKIYGIIPGVTDRDYYTNSFHVPVYYHITAFKKIQKEAPYHGFTNGGHISYVEVDGDPTNNLEAFEAIVRCMKEAGIGYGSINHPVDRDPCCGYSGVIEGHICPKCGRDETKGEYKFEKIRRITGYLVGTVDRFNNGKAAEERDRVKHG